MLRFRASSVLVPLAVLALAIPAAAQPPEIGAGECLYLVGAPPGAPAAETEETFEESRIYDGCRHPAQVDLNRDAPNSVQAWIEADPVVTGGESICELRGAVGHVFTTSPDVPLGTRAWVALSADMAARIDSLAVGTDAPSFVEARFLVEESSPEGTWRVAEVPIWTFALSKIGDAQRTEAGGLRVPIQVRGGREYKVSVVLVLTGLGRFNVVDAGRPGTGLGASYDAIEVCLEAAGNGASATDDIERDLYERRCYPRLWLPEALGGRYDEARSLVATRLSQAVASGAPGVNEVLAERRLGEADAHASESDQQKACRALVHALHALTTP